MFITFSSHPDGWHMFYHFVGAVPRSTEVDLVLKRLIRELNIVPVSSDTLSDTKEKLVEATFTQNELKFLF